MNFAFRADASVEIGTGHVTRCLALAEALAAKGARVSFVCRTLPESVAVLIRQRGAELSIIQDCQAGSAADATQTRQALRGRTDWLVVDNYAISEPWEGSLRPSASRILVIDDLANRRHDCDVILDQNYYDNAASRYDGLVPDACFKALGPQFALLRREFYESRMDRRHRDGEVKKILISFGGSDPTNETAKALDALRGDAFRRLQIEVIIGGAAAFGGDLVRRFAAVPNVRFHKSPPDVARLMAAADLCIGAGGTMTWERCFMGLPSIVIEIARNQSETSRALHRAGAIRNLGWHEGVTEDNIAETVAALIGDPKSVHQLGERALRIMEPEGKPTSEMRIVRNLTTGRS